MIRFVLKLRVVLTVDLLHLLHQLWEAPAEGTGHRQLCLAHPECC